MPGPTYRHGIGAVRGPHRTKKVRRAGKAARKHAVPTSAVVKAKHPAKAAKRVVRQGKRATAKGIQRQQGLAAARIQAKVNRVKPAETSQAQLRRISRQESQSYKQAHKPTDLGATYRYIQHQFGLKTKPSATNQVSDPGAALEHIKEHPLETAATAAAIVLPEAGGKILERAVARTGARAAEAEGRAAVRAAPKPKPHPEPAARKVKLPEPDKPTHVKVKGKVKGVKARAARAQARAAHKVEHPTETPKVRVKALGKKAVGKRSKVIRATAGAGAVAPPSGHRATPSIANRLSALVEGHRRAIFNNPLKTAGTTGRVIEGIPAAAAAIPADTYLSIKEGNTKPLEALKNQQVDYLKQVGKLFSGRPGEVERAVTNKVGLVPAATGVLGGRAAVKGYKATHTEPLSVPDKTIGAVEKVDRGTRKLAARRAAERSDYARRRDTTKKLEETAGKEPRHKVHRRNRAEAMRAARRESGVQAQLHAEMKGKGSRKAEFGGRRENLVELRGRLSRRHLTSKVTYADAERVAGAHGWRHDTKNLIGRIRAARQALARPGRKFALGQSAHTRRVLDAMAQHPRETLAMLEDADMQALLQGSHEVQHGRAIEAHEIATGEPQTTPHPGFERSTHQTQMRAEGVLAGHERPPHELRGEKLPKQKVGVDSEKAIRSQARTFQRRAKTLRTKAEVLEKEGLTSRAETLAKRAARYEDAANKRLAVVDRFKQAESLDRQAAKIDAGKAEGDAAALRAQADELRAAGRESQRLRHEEAMGELTTIQEKNGLAQPTYYKQTDISRSRAAGIGEDYPGSPGIKTEKFKRGTLEAQGRVAEGAEVTNANMVAQRVQLEQQKASISFLNEVPLRVRDTIFHTEDEINRLRLAGEIPAGYRAVAAQSQEFIGAIKRNNALKSMYDEARYRADVGRVKGGERRNLFTLVPESSIKQYRQQFENMSKAWRGLRAINRAQTGLLLATSPTWAEFQLLASPFQIAARTGLNVGRYLRGARAARSAWKNLEPREKAALESEWGANSGNMLEIGQNDVGLRPSEFRKMSSALNAVYKSPLGRFAHSLGKAVRRGGPLIWQNRHYEAKLRLYAGMLEMDRLAGLDVKGRPSISAETMNFVTQTAGLTETIYRHQKLLEGMSPAERVRFYAQHPRENQELTKGLVDTMGSWGDMTHLEQRVAAATVFYPFVRYSLRWMFYAYPKENPLKMAVLLNMAQSNDVELKKILGGNPTFLQTFGIVVTHPGGKPSTGLNLARAVPGGNAVIEALGSGKINLQTFLRPFQPLAGILAQSLTQKSSTGEESTQPPDIIFERGLAGLSPLTRPFVNKIGTQSFTSKLFQAIQDSKPQTGLGIAVPPVITDLQRQHDSVQASKLLDVIYSDIPGLGKAGESSLGDVGKLPKSQWGSARKQIKAADKAWKTIDKLAVKYGVETPASQKKALKTATKRRKAYTEKHGIFGTGTPKSSSSGGLGGGLGGGGLSGGGL